MASGDSVSPQRAALRPRFIDNPNRAHRAHWDTPVRVDCFELLDIGHPDHQVTAIDDQGRHARILRRAPASSHISGMAPVSASAHPRVKQPTRRNEHVCQNINVGWNS